MAAPSGSATVPAERGAQRRWEPGPEIRKRWRGLGCGGLARAALLVATLLWIPRSAGQLEQWYGLIPPAPAAQPMVRRLAQLDALGVYVRGYAAPALSQGVRAMRAAGG